MINVQTKPQLLEARTLRFTANIIYFCRELPKNTENKVISAQLIRSASSIGANYAEANNASSRLDFKNKIFIAKKEAAETRYWLNLAAEVNSEIEPESLIDEISQLIFFFQKIITTMKNGN